jgi:hypothetical protein
MKGVLDHGPHAIHLRRVYSAPFSLAIFSFRILMPPACVPPPEADSLGICGPTQDAVRDGALYVHHNLVAGASCAAVCFLNLH